MREFKLLNLRVELYVSWTGICSRPQEEHLKLKTYGQPYAPLRKTLVILMIIHIYIVKASLFEVIKTFNIIKV